MMESTINDGGPAFPVAPDSFGPSGETSRPFYGMSLRAYFAGQALAAIIPLQVELTARGNARAENGAKEVALACVGFADALISELDKETTNQNSKV